MDSRIQLVIGGAHECRATVAMQVGDGLTAAGKPKALLARFVLPVAARSVREVCQILRASLANVNISVSLPKVGDGDRVTITLRPIYHGKDLADVVEALASGKTTVKPRKARTPRVKAQPASAPVGATA